jgi:hypothetical protein
MPKANLLTDIKVGEVSFVPKAANKRKFLLFKSEDGLEDTTTPLISADDDTVEENSETLSDGDPNVSEDLQQSVEVEETPSSYFSKLFNPVISEDSSMNEELLKAATEVELENEEAITEAVEKAELPEDKVETAKGILKLFKAAELSPEFIGALAALAGYEAPVVEKVVEVPAKTDEEIQAEVKKEALANLSPEAREYVEKAMEASEEASRIAKDSAEKLAKAEDEKKTSEFIRKAEIDYPNFPIKAQDLGPILKSVSEAVEAKQFEEVVRILKAADEAIKTRQDFTEVDTQIKETIGLDSLDIAVSELRKADPNLTQEQAVLKACEDNPKHYQDYIQVGG